MSLQTRSLKGSTAKLNFDFKADMDIQHWTLPGAQNQTIYGTTHLPNQNGHVAGSILICHGFKGYKDYGFLPILAQKASERGIVAHRFNFSHSGVSDDSSTFSKPDLFENNTWSKQIFDLNVVAKAVQSSDLPGTNQGLPQIWFGHSRGGVTVILAAAGNVSEENMTPNGIVTAASPCSSYGFSEDQLTLLRDQGFIESPSSRTGQNLRIKKIWLDEIESDPINHDPIDAISKITKPIRIIHGDQDETVHIDAAHMLHNASKSKSSLHIIENATHTFNAPNPMAIDTPAPAQTTELTRLTLDFAQSCCVQHT